jgi:hypothetical protein
MRTSLLAALALLAGCATYHTPNGPQTGTPLLTWTFPTGPGLPAAGPFARGVPPSSLGEARPPAPPAPDLTGRYSGMATVVFNPGMNFDCTDLALHGALIVDGQHARLLTFTGTIRQDGQVVMQAGDKWISGRFIGHAFQGELLRRFPACSWNLSLTRDR